MARRNPSSRPTPAIETAIRLLSLLALFAVGPLPAQPADCAECHAEIAETYAQTGMGRSFSRLEPGSTAADFQENNSYFHAASERFYRAVERDGRFFLRRYQQDADGGEINVLEKEMHYALGSGNHAIGFLHRTPDNRLLQLPVSWYASGGGYWEMAPGYDLPDHAGFRRGVDLECLFCHNAYPSRDVRELPGAAVQFPAELPQGIDCARCHGDGARHAAAARAGEPAAQVRAAIFQPARTTPERQLEVCMQCHLETTTNPLPHTIRRAGRGYFSHSPAERLSDYALHFDHAPGRGFDEKFEVVSAVYRLRQSRCFQHSEAMTCTTCHDPHHAERGETAARRYDSICQSCHDPSSAPGDPHLVRSGCADCHMPKRSADDAPHVRMTDHRIAATPDSSAHNRADKPAYRGPVELYYPPQLDDEPAAELYLALAQVQGGANVEAGLPRLARAIRRQQPRQPEFAYQLGEGYRRAGRKRNAVEAYREALGQDAEFWPAALGLGLALAAGDDWSGAAEALAPHAGRDASVGVALGDAYYRLGRLGQARETLLAALELDPDSPEAHNNLGVVYLAQKRSAAAEVEFREAIRHRPHYGSAHANLGVLLLSAGRAAEAVERFETAISHGQPGLEELLETAQQAAQN